MSNLKTTMFASLMLASQRVVFLTGAGMSTESGVPDFRSHNGLWQDKDIMELASPMGLEEDFESYTEFYRWRMNGVLCCKPNPGHHVIGKWYKRGAITTVITQNVDGFHQEAGVDRVVELHGSIRSVRCSFCEASWSDVEYLKEGGNICACGGKMRPNVVMFGEGLDEQSLINSLTAAQTAQLFVVLGSSLAVSPANKLPLIAKQNGAKFVIVNNTETQLDDAADLIIREPIGKTLEIVDLMMGAQQDRSFRAMARS